ncbi:acetyl-CoA carboxylase carboxyltransferase subunit alpha/beta [Ornithinimicrobium faecis]|uniref:Acetyl-CoA carboxylase carboxyltransferase subunit alpha/beta n=1 Tax=Ornithinimicrobium faecis TaxID=2934158 RepID=A0ABY4YRP1_9MICO|nr:acetyl-CoA carboxylase carboxyltransferase subunit alpha/beta [Ornithinimicrobium sp. HY1793]USQ79247.1 acetyl-CoA carboxylase carboxyltransferase subunit alpha/beta [Ornithinimicrobium sp. HY1793]
MPRLPALEVLATVLDQDSFISWDQPVEQPNATAEYAAQLARARERTSLDEAVVTGEGRLAGRRVAAVASEFGFLAGSIGSAAGERLTQAFERATLEGLPMLASPSSGGTRMQEGTSAFIQMVKIGQAVAAHRRAGLPYLVYLRDPTTGGVLASWGSLGHLTVAEPGALIGFLGPRVREVILGTPFPEGVQTAENLTRRGVIDGVVPLEGLRETAIGALEVLTSAQEPPGEHVADTVVTDRPAWSSVEATRRSDRPGLRELLQHGATRFIALRGTGSGESDLTVILGLARLAGVSCVLVGQDRRAQQDDYLGPAALRVAQRGFALAEELDLPLVTVIDTPGADLSTEAEHGGMAGEIARCLAKLATVEVPVVSVILGEGTGGGALALMPADRTVCAENGWIAPLPPEGASAIVHRDSSQAAQMAEAHHIRAVDLLALGAVDEIVPERPDAADEPEAFCQRILVATASHLGELLSQTHEARMAARHNRYRRMR